MLILFYFENMEDEDRTWQYQGRIRYIIFRLRQATCRRIEKRHQKLSQRNVLAGIFLPLILPFQLENVGEISMSARRRLLNDFQKRNDLTGMEMYQMEQDIGRREGPAF